MNTKVIYDKDKNIIIWRIYNKVFTFNLNSKYDDTMLHIVLDKAEDFITKKEQKKVSVHTVQLPNFSTLSHTLVLYTMNGESNAEIKELSFSSERPRFRFSVPINAFERDIKSLKNILDNLYEEE